MGEPLACPDGGTCHHGCEQVCWRVREAGPLSSAGYPGDRWPAEVVAAHTPALTSSDLWRLLERADDADDLPVRAVTPHGSYAFDIVGATWEGGHVHLRMVEAVRACPECAAGKCGNCSGEAWDTRADAPTQCPCALLAHPRRTA